MDEIKYDLNALNMVIDKVIYNELCKVKDMKPLLDTLAEYGITGTKALSFIMTLAQRGSEENDQRIID